MKLFSYIIWIWRQNRSNQQHWNIYMYVLSWAMCIIYTYIYICAWFKAEKVGKQNCPTPRRYALVATFLRVWAYAGTVSRIESEQGYGLGKKTRLKFKYTWCATWIIRNSWLAGAMNDGRCAKLTFLGRWCTCHTIASLVTRGSNVFFSCQGFAPILLEVAIQTLTRGCKLFLTIFKNLYATLDHIYQRSMQDKIVQKKLAQVINSTVIRFSVYVIR